MPSQWTHNLKGYYPHHWWRQKTFAWTAGEILACWTPHLHHLASSTSQCVLCIQKIMTPYLQSPILSPQSTSPLHVPRASWGERHPSVECYWWTQWNGWEKTKPCSLWHTLNKYKRMHTDAQSYTVPLKYVAVYMYSISTSMYSLRCCPLHADL